MAALNISMLLNVVFDTERGRVMISPFFFTYILVFGNYFEYYINYCYCWLILLVAAMIVWILSYNVRSFFSIHSSPESVKDVWPEVVAELRAALDVASIIASIESSFLHWRAKANFWSVVNTEKLSLLSGFCDDETIISLPRAGRLTFWNCLYCNTLLKVKKNLRLVRGAAPRIEHIFRFQKSAFSLLVKLIINGFSILTKTVLCTKNLIDDAIILTQIYHWFSTTMPKKWRPDQEEERKQYQREKKQASRARLKKKAYNREKKRESRARLKQQQQQETTMSKQSPSVPTTSAATPSLQNTSNSALATVLACPLLSEETKMAFARECYQMDLSQSQS